MTNIWDSTRGYCHTLVLHTLWLHEYAYNNFGSCALQFYGFAEESLRYHLRGRRHLETLNQITTAERSVYVRGFLPHRVQETELCQVFQQFGAIHKISFGPSDKKVGLGVWHLCKVL